MAKPRKAGLGERMARRPLPAPGNRRTLPGMSLPARTSRPATVADLLAIPEAERHHEIIDGELVRKAMPSWSHGRAQLRVGGRLSDPYDRPSGRGGPGGWWFVTEVEIELAPDQVYRPDIAGWRREHLPTPPAEFPVRLRPDWVCEVLSPTNAGNDTVKKLRTYHLCQVPHYWILDPLRETLTVLRWTADGYLLAAAAERGDRVRAEPFDAVALELDDRVGAAPAAGSSR
jgi:Uma2 family endonuclease